MGEEACIEDTTRGSDLMLCSFPSLAESPANRNVCRGRPTPGSSISEIGSSLDPDGDAFCRRSITSISESLTRRMTAFCTACDIRRAHSAQTECDPDRPSKVWRWNPARVVVVSCPPHTAAGKTKLAAMGL